MKHRTLFLFVVAIASTGIAQESERQYISPNDLRITEEGIYVRKDSALVPLESISYDYSAGKFYAKDSKTVALITCPRCGQKTYSPEHEICFNPECQRSWSLER